MESKKYFINYAAGGFFQSQLEAIEAANTFGFDCTSYNESSLDVVFQNNNKQILSSPRGKGYWLWKPYIVLKKLNEINFNDYLVYMDAGAKFVRDPSPILDQIDCNIGMLFFDMIQPTYKWTKGDCFEKIPKHSSDFYPFFDRNQIQATYLFIRKTPTSVQFLESWFDFCQDPQLITDCPSIYKPNPPGFIDHRHDQAILSLMVHDRGMPITSQIDQYCVEHGLRIEERMYVDRHGRRQ